MSSNNTHIALSIIIPVYNGAAFIPNLISSLKQHTFKEVEYLFIDNNSADDSVSLLKALLLQTDLNYQLLNETRQGPGYARNTGIEVASGKYIGFLDCDDTVHPEKYAHDIAILETESVDFVFCRAKRFYTNGREVLHPIEGIKEGINTPPSLGLAWLVNFFRLQGTGALIAKKEVIQAMGGFHTSMTGEDAFLFIKMGLTYTGYFYDKIYFQYYRHEFSLSYRTNKSGNANLFRYLDQRMNLYADTVVKQHANALRILERQIYIDLLILHSQGINMDNYIKDERLKGLSRHFLVTNSFSLFLTKTLPHLKYNPFYQAWIKLTNCYYRVER